MLGCVAHVLQFNSRLIGINPWAAPELAMLGQAAVYAIFRHWPELG
jgi:hypothetical protein